MLKKSDLIKYFENGIKNTSEIKIGTEHEKFIYHKSDLSLVPYSGDVSINSIFDDFIKDGWTPIKENENIIALNKDRASITLEPGGQFELSGAPLKTIHETCKEINNHLEFTKKLEEKYNIGFLGLGFFPIGELKDVPMVPKKRYSEIMTPYMKSLSGLGLEMMYQSATVQANFDYISESDMQRKINVSAFIQPIVTGLFSNSPFKNSKLSGFETYRGYVWTKTDPNRTGIPKFLTEKTLSFEEYVDYALQVPVYSIIRNNNYHDCTKYTFQDLLDGKNNQFAPDDILIEDWINHISTIFTEVRLKTFIEMRGADAGSYDTLCALPAFWSGILYQEEALEETIKLISEFEYDDLIKFRSDVLSNGLNSLYKNKTGWQLAEKLINISFEGLKKRSKKNLYGDDETVHLDYLFEVIDKKETASEKAKKLYFQNNELNIQKLFEGESF